MFQGTKNEVSDMHVHKIPGYMLQLKRENRLNNFSLCVSLDAGKTSPFESTIMH
jgi:hypothetical protein